MNDEQKRIVEALRCCGDSDSDFDCGNCPLEPDGDECCKLNLLAADLIEQLSTELEQIKRERDAAVDDINRILRLHVDERHPCEFCKNSGGSMYPECEYADMGMCLIAEWRGLCAENGGK